MSPLPPGSWVPAVHEGLLALLRGRPGHAVFDWDNTVLEGDLSREVMRHLDRTTGTTREQEYDRLLASEGRLIAYPLVTQWLAGHTRKQLRGMAERIVMDALTSEVVRIRPDMRALIDRLHGAGWTTWIVSASPRAVIAAGAARLGIPRQRVLAMRLKMDQEGRTTAVLTGHVTTDQGKADAVADLIPEAPLLAAGDSASDLGMLALAEHVILIDKGDDALRRHASEQGWWLQTGWRHTETA